MTKVTLVASFVAKFADHLERTMAFNAADRFATFKGDAVIFNKARADGHEAFSKFLRVVGDQDPSNRCNVLTAYDTAAEELLNLRMVERKRLAPRRIATNEHWARKRAQLAEALAQKALAQ